MAQAYDSERHRAGEVREPANNDGNSRDSCQRIPEPALYCVVLKIGFPHRHRRGDWRMSSLD